MATLQQRSQRATRGSNVFSVPAPVEGWNARDQVDQVKDTEATELENFFAHPNSVALRAGQEVFSTVAPGPVSTIAEFFSQSTRLMVIAASGCLFSITSAGVGTLQASGYTQDRHQTVMFKEYLLGVNGSDTPWKFDGSTVAANTFTGSGLTPANLIGIAVHRERLYLWELAQPYFWYADTNSIAGALTKFDLARVGMRGGNLIAVQTWTRDGGNGMDDFVCFFMTSGDCIVYQGGDPSDPANWNRVGVYQFSAPFNRRGVIKYGGDILVLTRDGIMSLNLALPFAQTRSNIAITDKISGAFHSAVADYQTIDGWQLVHYPHGPWLLCNVPQVMSSSVAPQVTPESEQSYQFAMNTDTGAWSKFTNMNARCFGMFNDNLYIGGIGGGAAWNDGTWNESPWAYGAVIQVDSGNNDLVLDQYGNPVAEDITAYLRTKFFSMGAQTLKKRFLMARPVVESTGTAPYELAMSVDSNTAQPNYSTPNITQVLGSSWNTATWNVDAWSGGTAIFRGWQKVTGFGYTGALNFKVMTQLESVKLRAIDFMFEPGGLM